MAKLITLNYFWIIFGTLYLAYTNSGWECETNAEFYGADDDDQCTPVAIISNAGANYASLFLNRSLSYV